MDFGPSATLTKGFGPLLYDLQLTGPVSAGQMTLNIPVTPSDPNNVKVNADPVTIYSPASSTIVLNNQVLESVPDETVTLSATGRHVTQTATLIITSLK